MCKKAHVPLFLDNGALEKSCQNVLLVQPWDVVFSPQTVSSQLLDTMIHLVLLKTESLLF